MLRRMLVALCSLPLMLAVPTTGMAQEMFRSQLSAPIFFGGTPSGGGEVGGGEVGARTVSIAATVPPPSRIPASIDVAVAIDGMLTTDRIVIAGLNGASWNPTATGRGNVEWSSPPPGDHKLTVEVLDDADKLLDRKVFDVPVRAAFAATLPRTVYSASIGRPLKITPELKGAIGSQPGDVLWATDPTDLPPWLDLNEHTGEILVDTSVKRSTFPIGLTAVDQIDWADSVLSPFTVAVTDRICQLTQKASANDNIVWKSVAHGNGRFVAVANGSATIMTSADGDSWAAKTGTQTGNWVSVTYGGGKFVAISRTGTTRIMTSTDGLNWTPRALPSGDDGGWNSVVHGKDANGNGIFVAVGETNTRRIMTSPDGEIWTSQTAPAQNAWTSVAYGNGRFVAVSRDGTRRVMVSTNGTEWSSETLPTALTMNSIVYGDNGFVAVGSGVARSSDGVTWTMGGLSSAGWNAVAYGNGFYAAVNGFGTQRAATSVDGLNWMQHSVFGTWQGIAYGNDKFVAVGGAQENRLLTFACN